MRTRITIDGKSFEIIKNASETYRVYDIDDSDMVRPNVRSFASLKEAYDYIFVITLQS